MVRPLAKLEPGNDSVRLSFVSTYNPFRIAVSVLRRCVTYFFPPSTTLRIASHLVPFFVCVSLIPLILFFSLFSGWYIWKNIPVGWQVPIYLQYGDGFPPYAELSLPPLSTTQPYDVSLQLVLPASDSNFALGNFMITLSFSTAYNKTLVTASKPSIVLPPKRSMLSFSSTPRLIDLNVPLLYSYLPATSALNARIDLGRKDGWKGVGEGVGRELSVWNAALKGVVRLHGIRGLVSRFPLIFSLMASGAFFSLSLIILAACILPAAQWRTSVDELPSPSESREDRPARVRKRPRRVVTGESRPYKTEDTPVDIPSVSTSDTYPLKRRRSRMSDALLDSEN
ncbi:putative adipose-regulatory protein-domain-containing protein [Chiua virens]|nr:putative adipose-regulatory protein-domain-containing protein [Chiua virens]